MLQRHLLAPTLLLVAILATVIGFFPRWGIHGLYMDDYTEKAWAFDFARAQWKLVLRPQFHIRPFAHILIANVGNAIPGHEFPIRLAIALMHWLNVLLLAWLSYRLSGSLFVAIATGALFLFPILGNEALLWFAAAVSNTVSIALLLIGFHCLLSCEPFDWPLFCLAVVAWILMALFYEAAIFTLLLLPVFLSAARARSIWQDRKIWLPALAASYIPIGLYLLLIERTDPDVVSRGGTTLNLHYIISTRIPEVLDNLCWLVSDRGRLPGHRFALISGPLREALRLGWREWGSSLFGLFVMASLFLGILLLAFAFPVDANDSEAGSRLSSTTLAGVAWMILCLVPILLVKSQIVEIRTLYAPSAGFALSAGSLLGLPLNYFSRWKSGLIRVGLLISGMIIFFTSLAMAGVVRTYQLRSSLDQKQVGGLVQIISRLPANQRLWLLPIHLDERSFGADSTSDAALEAYVYGVFEIPWSARDAVRLITRREEVDAVTGNRWVDPDITSVSYSGGRGPTTLSVQGHLIPIEQLLAFTYQQGHIILLSPLRVESAKGKPVQDVRLPLVEELARMGIETEKYNF